MDVDFENSLNPYDSRRMPITDFINSYARFFVSETKRFEVENKAAEFQKQGIKFKDACHVACAILSSCGYFISTDDRLLKFRTSEIILTNPMDFVRMIQK